ncbi:hypothetical protein R1sor_019380 [Riccia sorocarpa]|uniref:Uncharacterized protein n=1 Tax=Riccia sorocarpa TaxID=122646 RepID=A0ABD3ICG4_9MARC
MVIGLTADGKKELTRICRGNANWITMEEFQSKGSYPTQSLSAQIRGGDHGGLDRREAPCLETARTFEWRFNGGSRTTKWRRTGRPRWISQALQKKHIKLVYLILFIVDSRQIWKEPCEQHFRQSVGTLPIDVTLQESITTIKEMKRHNLREKALEEMEESQAYLLLMKDKNRGMRQLAEVDARHFDQNSISSDILFIDSRSLQRTPRRTV